MLSLAMVTIETPGLKPKRLLTLDKNFHVPSTMSLNHGKVQIIFFKERLTKCHYDLKFCNKRNFQQITYANYHHETSYSF